MVTKSTLKYIQSLRLKKFRDEHGSFVAEGKKTVHEFLVDGLFACESLLIADNNSPEMQDWIDLAGSVPVSIVAVHEIEKLSSFKNPQNVLAVFQKKKAIAHPDLNGTLSFVLNAVQDPGNVGTIIRIADWFNIPNLFYDVNTSDPYGPKVVQASMGSLGRVNLVQTHLETLFDTAKEIQKFAAVLDGEMLDKSSPVKEGMIIIGNESAGISPELLAAADHRITIPRIGKAESLNAAVAAGIIAYALTGRA